MTEKFTIIHSQHDEIFNLITLLKKKVKEHIYTENELLDYRNKIKPDTHIQIIDKIREHKEKHTNFLIKIDDLENELDTHIKLYDKVHIHKL